AMAEAIKKATKNTLPDLGGPCEPYLEDGYLEIIAITKPEGGSVAWDKNFIKEEYNEDIGHVLRVKDTADDPADRGFSFFPSYFSVSTSLSNEAKTDFFSLNWPATQYEIDNKLNEQRKKEKELRDKPQNYEAPTADGTYHELDLSTIHRDALSSSYSGTVRYDKNSDDYYLEDKEPIAKMTQEIRNKYSNVFGEEFYITNISPQDITVNEGNNSIKVGVSGGASYSWTTADDPNLPGGTIISNLQTFNKDGFNPAGKEKKLIANGNYPIISDTTSENSKKYTFLAHNPLEPSDNPNIIIEGWKLNVKDLTGSKNTDLGVAKTETKIDDIYLDKENHYGNDAFKVKLKLDSAERSYVEIAGQAGGPYDLMYFDGNSWKTFWHGSKGAIGSLGYFNVSRLNGKYSVLLKVYDEGGNYSIAQKDVLIGTPIDKDTKGRATSPYKRAELNFPVGAFGDKDELVTITPVRANEIDISNRPVLITVGPIVEIKPSPTTFKFDEKGDLRPTLTFRYTGDDLKELYPSIDTSNLEAVKGLGLNIHQITSSGDLQVIQKSDQSCTTEGGVESGGKVYAFTAALDHFSDYVLLEGEHNLKAPLIETDKYIVNYDEITIYGTAQAESILEVFVTQNTSIPKSAKPQITGGTNKTGGFRFENVKLTAEGKNYIFVTCKKKANDTDQTSSYIIVTYDITPTEVEGAANLASYSPNGDGKYDEVKYAIRSNEPAMAHFAVQNPKGETIINEEFYAEENKEADVVWKGKTLDIGNLRLNVSVPYTLSDGEYTYNIFAIDEAGNISKNIIGKTVLDTTPPKIKSLTASPNPFTPNGDGVKDTTTISYELNEPAYVVTEILRSDSGSLYEYGELIEGKGSWVWNGKGSRGESYGGQCSYYLIAEDLVGNSASSETQSLFVDIAPSLITYGYAEPSTFSPGNPKNGLANIYFELSRDGLKINLKIMDGSGNLVKSLIKDENKDKGKQVASWDGSYDSTWTGPKSGSKVYNGSYSFKLEAADPGGGEPAIITGTIIADGSPPNIICEPVIVDPENKTAALNYTISEAANAKIKLLDESGGFPETLLSDKSQSSGKNSVSWDFKSLSGEELTRKFKFNIEATDKALNTATKSSESFILASALNLFAITEASISPSPFSPNGDSFKDFTNIRYNISGGEPEYTVDLRILNSSGGTVKILLDGERQGTGIYTLSWFGLNDKGENLPDGKYTYKISAADKAGNTVGSSGIVLLVRNTSVTLSANPIYFSPAESNMLTFTCNISYYFELTGEAESALRIYGSSNHEVYEFKHSYSQGTYTYNWDGKDNNGQIVPDGTYTASIAIQDPAGTIASSGNTTLTVDTSLPDPPALSGIKSPTNKTLISATGEAEPLSTINIYVNGVKKATAEADAAGLFNTGPAVQIEEGSNSIYAKAVDAAGNTSGPSNTVSVSCDLSRPAVNLVTLSDPSPTKVGNISITLSFSKTMDMSINPILTFGLASPFNLHVVSSSSTWQDDKTWKVSYVIDETTGDGLNAFAISGAADPAGNVMDEDTGFSFIIDTLLPDKPTINQPSSPTNRSALDISGYAEPNSRVTLYQGGSTKEANANGSGLWTINTTISLGVNTFEARSTDPADNESALSNKTYVIYDPVPPEFSNLLSNPALRKGGEVENIAFTASEALFDNPTVLVLTNEATCVTSANLNYEYSYAVKSLDPTGLASITIIGTDEAGNTGIYTAKNAFECFYIDNTLPVTSISTTAECIANPNAFTPNHDGQSDSTTLMYTLSEDSYVTLKVYLFSESGIYNDSNLVKNLITSQLETTGEHSHIWDGSVTSNLSTCDTDNNGYADNGKYAFIVSAADRAGNIAQRMGGSVFVQDIKLTLVPADQVANPPDPNPLSPAVSGSTGIIYKLTGTTSGEGGISHPIGPLSMKKLMSTSYNIGKVSIKVFDGQHNYINTLKDENGNPIENKLLNNQTQNQYANWNGKKSSGQDAGEGIYSIVATAEDFTGVPANNLTYSVVLDRTPPAITNVSVDTNYFSPGVSIGDLDEATISYTLADNLSGITTEMTNEVTVQIDVFKGETLIKNFTQSMKQVNAGGIPFSEVWDGKNNGGTYVGENPSGNSDGTYTFRITATDLAGNSSQATAEVVADTVAPTGTIIINNNNKYTKLTPVTLTLSASDNLSGVNKMCLSNDGSNFTTPEAYGTSKSWTLSGPDGIKNVYVRYKDLAGNYSDLLDSIILDTTPPSITNIQGSPNPFKDSTTISADISDASMEAVNWRLIIDCGSGHTPKTYNGSFEASQNINISWDGRDGAGVPALLPSGPYNLSVFATDEAGNSSAQASTITIDRDGPTGSVTIEAGARCTRNTSVTINLSATDNYSGVSTMRFSNNGSVWSAEEPYATSKSYTLTAGEGEKTVYVKLKDGVGNTSTESDTIILDQTPPNISLPPQEQSFNPYTDNEISLTYNLTDAHSQSANVSASITLSNGSTLVKQLFTNSLININFGSGSGEAVWNGMNTQGNYVNEGIYKLVITARDQVGNEGTENFPIVLVDDQRLTNNLIDSVNSYLYLEVNNLKLEWLEGSSDYPASMADSVTVNANDSGSCSFWLNIDFDQTVTVTREHWWWISTNHWYIFDEQGNKLQQWNSTGSSSYPLTKGLYRFEADVAANGGGQARVKITVDYLDRKHDKYLKTSSNFGKNWT
ncbi:MAG: Ig-like domain repeat protein, partial [Candidatus Saganbacteria bacterium]|nr:Ig-like domain repeat protein [Candidatus Saganbacteria bacterium]